MKWEKVCTLALPIITHKSTGVLGERDCVKCSECIAVCPVGALSWNRAGNDYPTCAEGGEIG